MRAKGTTTAWSHDGLERRGYRKCPYCWRHLVKLEEHVASHEAGLIGPDGKRRDRTSDERARWAARYNGRAGSVHGAIVRKFVPRNDLKKLLELPTVDMERLRRDLDKVTRPES